MNSRLLRVVALLTLVITALVLAACGEDSSGGGGNAGANPASVAPLASPVYFEATVKPGGSQKDALDALTQKVAGNRDLGADIKKALDKQFATDPKSKGRTYAKDIAPWLGDRIGVTVASLSFPATAASAGGAPKAPFAVIVATKDAGKAQDEINSTAKQDKDPKGAYKGVSYYTDDNELVGIVGDFLVVGNAGGFRSVVDAKKAGKGLADSPRFKEATDTLASDRLGFGYVDGQSIVGALAKSSALPASARQSFQSIVGSKLKGTITFSVVAKDDGVLVETQTPLQPGKQTTSLLGNLPGDSWLAIAAPNVGATIKNAAQSFKTLAANAGSSTGGQNPAQMLQLAQSQLGLNLNRDLLSWLGDTAFFAGGTSLLNLSAGVVIQSTNTTASARAIKKFEGLAKRFGAAKGATVTPAPGGFALQVQGAPGSVQVAQRGDKVVIAYGANAVDHALSPPQKLSDAPGFKAAQQSIGSDINVSGYIAFQPIFALAQGLGATNSAGYQKAKPYLDALDSIVFGTKTEGDKTLGRFLVKVK
jgi:hypothetical protein